MSGWRPAFDPTFGSYPIAAPAFPCLQESVYAHVLVRWPNGLVSIATADDMKDLCLELAKDEVCTEREADNGEWDSPHGLIMELPKGFRLHFEFNDDADLEFHPFPSEAGPTMERLFPHLYAVMKVHYKTKKAAMAAAKEAMDKERQGLKGE